MDAHKHDVDSYLARTYPGLYAAPRSEPTPSVDETVIQPITPGRPSARRSERHQAIADATSWIGWLIEYRAELADRLPQTVTRPGPARKASLERGRAARHHH